MNKDIFEIDYDGYIGFLSQIRKSSYYSQLTDIDENHKELSIYSVKTNKLLASQIVDKDDNKTFYVYEMPDDDERCAAPAVTKIELQTPEEVKAFFDILNQATKKYD